MKKIILAILVVAFATAAYAFASSGTISAAFGYRVTKIVYTYDPIDPSLITYVDFDISPAISQVSVSLVSGGAFTDCGALIANGTHAHCPVNVVVASADMLRIATSE